MKSLYALSLILLVVGCDSPKVVEPSLEPLTGRAKLTLAVPASVPPSLVEKIEYSIYGGGMTDRITGDFPPISNNTARITLDIPTGTNRTFSVKSYSIDDEGYEIVTYEGNTVADVNYNETVEVNVDMERRHTRIRLTGSLPTNTTATVFTFYGAPIKENLVIEVPYPNSSRYTYNFDSVPTGKGINVLIQAYEGSRNNIIAEAHLNDIEIGGSYAEYYFTASSGTGNVDLIVNFPEKPTSFNWETEILGIWRLSYLMDADGNRIELSEKLLQDNLELIFFENGQMLIGGSDNEKSQGSYYFAENSLYVKAAGDTAIFLRRVTNGIPEIYLNVENGFYVFQKV